MKLKQYNWNMISSSRLFLMGIATIWIVIYHSGIGFNISDGPGLKHLIYIGLYQLYTIKSAGQIGVDIFLIISAMGLYYSLKKNDDIRSFYIRRFKRIIPAYLIVFLLWDIFIRRYDLLTILSNATGLSLLKTGYRDNWYFILIIFLYLIYPFIFKLKEKFGYISEVLLILFVLLINYLLSIFFPVSFSNIEIVLRRIPVFLVGSIISEFIYNKKQSNILIVLISFVIMCITLYIVKLEGNEELRIYRYLCCINAVSMMIVFSYLYSFIGKSIIVKPINTCGIYSLETYLLYEKIIYVLRMYIDKNERMKIALLAVLICIPLAYLLKKLTESLFRERM